eukprot:107476-Karenia_brevis.AAC.1
MKLRSEEQVRILTYIMSAATWTSQQLHEIGDEPDATCCLCGEVQANVTHCLWDCSVVNKAIKDHRQLQLNKEWLPEHLRYGIPGAMAARLDGPFWREPREVSAPQTEEQRYQL